MFGTAEVLGRFLDALYLSVRGEIPKKVLGELYEAKDRARASGANGFKVPFKPRGVPGGRFVCRPYGAKKNKYQFVLENRAMILEVSTWANLPALRIEFKARTLYELDLEALERVSEAVAGWLLRPGYRVKVARADVAVDFQMFDDDEPPPIPAVEDVICRASRRRYEFHGTRATAVTLGTYRAPLQAQIYAKSEEIKVSGKTWLYEVWERSEGHYEPGRPVWRCEFRFQRRALRELVRPGEVRGVESIADLRDGLGDLLAVVVGDSEGAGSWLRVADPETRGSKADRRGSCEWWEVLRGAFLAGLSSVGRVRVAGGPDVGSVPYRSLDHEVRKIGRAVTRAAAMARRVGLASTSDEELFWNGLRFRYGEHRRRGGETFASEVQREYDSLTGVLIEAAESFGFGSSELRPAEVVPVIRGATSAA